MELKNDTRSRHKRARARHGRICLKAGRAVLQRGLSIKYLQAAHTHGEIVHLRPVLVLLGGGGAGGPLSAREFVVTLTAALAHSATANHVTAAALLWAAAPALALPARGHCAPLIRVVSA